MVLHELLQCITIDCGHDISIPISKKFASYEEDLTIIRAAFPCTGTSTSADFDALLNFARPPLPNPGILAVIRST
jgi:hypothetical protein